GSRERPCKCRGRRRRLVELEGRGRRLDLTIDRRQRSLRTRRRRLAQGAIQARNGRVDAVEERVLFGRCLDDRLQALVVGHGWSRRRADATAVLRPLEAEAQPRERLIRVSKDRIVFPTIDTYRPVFVL